MLCDVYILYQSNEPRLEAEVKTHPVRGWLCYGDAGRSYPHDEAHLYRSRTDATEVIPFVDFARVRKIKRGGLRIEGMQRHNYNDYWKQAWWCLPVCQEQPSQHEEQSDVRYEAIRAAVVQVNATGPACALDASRLKRPA
ncbi:hypothetical protein SAMN05518800_3249 [Variovorax sp. YR752]|uniref:hypothetical protein n=1 Tax=Variovorax sp. YR752 TaxID=1884383 RepID=UPI000BCED471|nr:hypothetical protein [Variovorax sp. YR752]SOD27684.1 hypothetical protein SAMN05518800_3249 [Variovorax sp. YR752]